MTVKKSNVRQNNNIFSRCLSSTTSIIIRKDIPRAIKCKPFSGEVSRRYIEVKGRPTINVVNLKYLKYC